MNSNYIRESFINFFINKGHKHIPSYKIASDDSSIYVNSGMIPFKKYFLSEQSPYSRIVSSQKCLIINGKYNKIEDVGYDSYNHTFFEVLGNRSFNDYYKKESIEYAWEYIVDILKINPDNLYVTVFKGNDLIDKDEESINIWSNIIDNDRIILEDEYNFWYINDLGLYGTSTEIHIDLRDDYEKNESCARDLINTNHPQIINLWNIVSIEYKKSEKGLIKLDNKIIDTSMYLERITRVVQNKKSIYDSDLYLDIINEISHLSNKEYTSENDDASVSMRIITDHLKSIYFGVLDGQSISNKGKGYTLKKLLRNAFKMGYIHLGIDNNTKIFESVLKLIHKKYADVYGYSDESVNDLINIINNELIKFINLIYKSLKFFDFSFDFSFDNIYYLYDTLGIPFDITFIVAERFGYNININEFEKYLNKIIENK